MAIISPSQGAVKLSEIATDTAQLVAGTPANTDALSVLNSLQQVAGDLLTRMSLFLTSQLNYPSTTGSGTVSWSGTTVALAPSTSVVIKLIQASSGIATDLVMAYGATNGETTFNTLPISNGQILYVELDRANLTGSTLTLHNAVSGGSLVAGQTVKVASSLPAAVNSPSGPSGTILIPVAINVAGSVCWIPHGIFWPTNTSSPIGAVITATSLPIGAIMPYTTFGASSPYGYETIKIAAPGFALCNGQIVVDPQSPLANPTRNADGTPTISYNPALDKFTPNMNGASPSWSTTPAWNQGDYVIQTAMPGGSAAGTITGTFTVSGQTNDSIAFDPSTNSLWTIGGGSSNQAAKVNATTGSDTLYVLTHGGNGGVAYDPSTSTVWFGGNGVNFIDRLLASTGAAQTAYTVPAAPKYLAYDSSTTSMWAALANNTVSKINTSLGTSVNFALPVGTTSVHGIAFDSSTNSVWVSCGGINAVAKIRASDGAPLGSFSVNTAPQGVAFDPWTASVWVADSSNNHVYKFRASDGASLGNFAVANGAHGVAYDQGTNSVWVAGTSGSVTKLDVVTGLTSATYGLSGPAPYGIVYDTFTNSVWTANWFNNSVTKIAPGLYGAPLVHYVAVQAVPGSNTVQLGHTGYWIPESTYNVTSSSNPYNKYRRTTLNKDGTSQQYINSFPRGSSTSFDSNNSGSYGGENSHVLTVNEMPAHNHGGNTGNESNTHVHTYVQVTTGGPGSGDNPQGPSGFVNNTGANNVGHTHPITTQGLGAGHNNQPAYYNAIHIVRIY